MNLKFLPERLRTRQSAVVSGLLGGTALILVSIFATGPSAAPNPIQERAWPVSITLATPSAMAPTFSAFGRLESPRIAHLRSDLIARVRKVNVREGEWVETGQVLVELDPREAELHRLERQAELLEARANLKAAEAQLKLEQQSAEHFVSRHDLAQAKLKRHQNLMQKRLIAKSLLDEVITQANQASIEFHNHQRVLSDLPNQIAALAASVTRAEALLARAELDLEKTRIVAPFSGPVLNVTTAPGDHTNLTAPLLEMADADAAEIRVQIPDAYVSILRDAIRHGTQISANLEGASLKLHRLASHVRTGQAGNDAFFTFTQPQSAMQFALGRVLAISVTLPPQPDLIALPVQALYDNDRIFTVNEDRLVAVPVEKVGEFQGPDGYRILVRQPELKSDTPIITTQLPRAMNGLLVQVANPIKPPAGV